jgi:hypothetical protein
MIFGRWFTMLAFLALPIAAVADLGSVVVVRMTVPDDAAEAGRAGVQAISWDLRSSAATPQNAQTAYEAASNVAKLHRQEVDPQTFTVFKDGSVHLTVTRTAPTVLFKRLPGIRSITSTKTTTTVAPVRY